ncbi:TraB/GumN family protein [Paraburkholderia sp. J94]|uniref:TraB/GumN family protein n=1 Tax=Paraburkholderia sp. J94 TaxID=2805441 RepID=UPI002AB2E011|nr:TraB/GumN family protein [Paraburkholderia sp. J94]
MINTDCHSGTRARAKRFALGLAVWCASVGLSLSPGLSARAQDGASREAANPATGHMQHVAKASASASAYRPALWTASLPGHPTLLLLPTIHGLASDDPRIDAALAALADRVQAIALETNVSPTHDNVQTILRYGLYPAADNLTNHMQSMSAEALAHCARDSGADIKVFFQHKPWLAGFVVDAVRLHEQRFEREDGAKPPRFVPTGESLVFAGIDARLESIAQRQRIPLIYLETIEQGMRLFDEMPAADQEAFLQGECAGLHGARQGAASYAQFQQAWVTGDAAQLERLAMARFPGESDAHYDFSQYLYLRGTDIFAETLAQYGYFYGKGPILVAVGAGHFFGAHSLLQRLHDAGYTVTGPLPALRKVAAR